MLVDFMIIGAQKCGTTTLANQLASHPDICFCRNKEPGYFNRTNDWKSTLEEYHSLYSPLPGQLTGEASTMYTFLPEWLDTHVRLYEYNPKLKLIYIMRNPVERIISNYAHRLVRSTNGGALDAAIFSDPVYINRSRYGLQLRPYLELFGDEQLMPIIFEEFITDQHSWLRRIANFIGVDPDRFSSPDPTTEAMHRTVGEAYLNPKLLKIRGIPGMDRMLQLLSPDMKAQVRDIFGKKISEKPKASTELRRLLWRFVEDDVKFVETLMKRRMDLWRREFDYSSESGISSLLQ